MDFSHLGVCDQEEGVECDWKCKVCRDQLSRNTASSLLSPQGRVW